MSPWTKRKRPKDPGYQPDDDRSFAVALRLEMVAKRLALINQELVQRLGSDLPPADEKGEDQ